MACIYKEVVIEVSADAAWDAVRDVGESHKRLFPGVLIDARLEPGARVVTFANGMVLRELIVNLDDARKRFAYTALGGRATHHNASIEVVAETSSGEPERSREKYGIRACQWAHRRARSRCSYGPRRSPVTMLVRYGTSRKASSTPSTPRPRKACVSRKSQASVTV